MHTRDEISLAGPWRYHVGDPDDDIVVIHDDAGWPTMELPANWFLRGLDTHGVVWFRRTFDLPSAFAGRYVRLCFDGVDYFADVWLNGVHLGRHEGYFQPFAFDVTSLVRSDEPNVLVVRVDSPMEEFGTVWHLRKRLIKGIFNHHDTRPGGGWGPLGQEQNTGGIWNDVRLAAHQVVRIERIQVCPRLSADATVADLDITITLENHGDHPLDVDVSGTIAPDNFGAIGASVSNIATRLTVMPGRADTSLTVRVDRPVLWWCWDQGEPNLYRLDLTAVSADETLDTMRTRFGIRSIAVDDRWVWRLNGRRIFLRGTNYIPTQWLAEMDAAAFRRDLDLMRQANVNAVRVHAHVNRRELYQVADEVGMLVWQDFALQWGYDDSEAFAENALRQQRDMIELLFNHPSIVVWCCHNESPWDAPWMASKAPDYHPDQNRALDERLAADARRLDPSRVVHLNSGTGDTHPYPGWYHSSSMWDFRDLPGAPFVTEFGAQALPSVESLEATFAEADRWPPNWDVWAYHDFQREETFQNAGIVMGSSLAEFVANSQAYQAALIQYAVECYRRAKWRPMTGVFQFMFVDNWPSITWSVLDYWRRPKAGFDALRRAFQPVLPCVEYRTDRFEVSAALELPLWIVNDLPLAFPGATLRWALRRGLSVSQAGEVLVDVPADDVVPAGRIVGDPTLGPGAYVLELEVIANTGDVLGTNEIRFTIGPIMADR